MPQTSKLGSRASGPLALLHDKSRARRRRLPLHRAQAVRLPGARRAESLRVATFDPGPRIRIAQIPKIIGVEANPDEAALTRPR